jgi:hypothetical protein
VIERRNRPCPTKKIDAGSPLGTFLPAEILEPIKHGELRCGDRVWTRP